MKQFVVLPGIGGSGENHWQTHWEAHWKTHWEKSWGESQGENNASVVRFSPPDWDSPVLSEWLESAYNAIKLCETRPILIAHSLACLLVPHLLSEYPDTISGVFMVAVPDPDGENFPKPASTFRDVPTAPLPIPAVMIASTNDPYGSYEYAITRSSQWECPVVNIGAKGHISDIGPWQEGRKLLTVFAAGINNT